MYRRAIARPYAAHRAAVVIYPRGGHVPSFSSPCLGSIVARFLEAPEAAPNSACLAQEPPTPFVVVPGRQ